MPQTKCDGLKYFLDRYKHLDSVFKSELESLMPCPYKINPDALMCKPTQTKRSLLLFLFNPVAIGLTFYHLYNQKHIEKTVTKLEAYYDILKEEVQRIKSNFNNQISVIQNFVVGVTATIRAIQNETARNY